MKISESKGALRQDFIGLLATLSGRRILVTGHTGFKGGWLSLWLKLLGAEVYGIALPPLRGPSFFDAVGLDKIIDSRIGDIRSPAAFAESVRGIDAEIVIHMAAQALVRKSYAEPIDTYLTNVVGTAVVLDAIRPMPSLRGAIVVTSDKCYENNEWVWGYRENDAMGGADPYSSSKGCAELVTAAYRRSFFSKIGGPSLSSARAGNVFGGGDWAVDRLVPDLVRSATDRTPIEIRNPKSIRPWQHVLEPLSGYLMLAAHLLSSGSAFANAWNFGPTSEGVVDVRTLAEKFQRSWGRGGPQIQWGSAPQGLHEANVLRLDSTKAQAQLGWRPRLSLTEAIDWTVEWYSAHAEGKTPIRKLSEMQIENYAARCTTQNETEPSITFS
jgi:CDP-glucose 4,6-dehydratase